MYAWKYDTDVVCVDKVSKSWKIQISDPILKYLINLRTQLHCIPKYHLIIIYRICSENTCILKPRMSFCITSYKDTFNLHEIYGRFMIKYYVFAGMPALTCIAGRLYFWQVWHWIAIFRNYSFCDVFIDNGWTWRIKWTKFLGDEWREGRCNCRSLLCVNRIPLVLHVKNVWPLL